MISEKMIEAFEKEFSKHLGRYGAVRSGLAAALSAMDAEPRKKLTKEELQALIDEGRPVFSDTNPEAEFISHAEMSCPYCGGSGHKDDVATPQASAVKVRDLVWVGSDVMGFQAETVIGTYRIECYKGGVAWAFNDDDAWLHGTHVGSVEIAKAEAKAHLDGFIRSTLLPDTGEVERPASVQLDYSEAKKICARLEYDASWDKAGDGYYKLKAFVKACAELKGRTDD